MMRADVDKSNHFPRPFLDSGKMMGDEETLVFISITSLNPRLLSHQIICNLREV